MAVLVCFTRLKPCLLLDKCCQACATVSGILCPACPVLTVPHPTVHANGIIHRDIKPDNTLLVHELLPVPPPQAASDPPVPVSPVAAATTEPPSPPPSPTPQPSSAGVNPPPPPPALLPHLAVSWSRNEQWAVPQSPSLGAMAHAHAEHLPMLRAMLGDNTVDSVTGTCVRLADLGVSLVFDSEARDDKIKATAGTPAFHAPEMFTGSAFSGCKADVWALGCTLFAMLTGRLPVDGVSSRCRPDELSQALLENKLRMDLVENCSATCVDFFRLALAKDPSQRLNSQELAAHPWLTLHGVLPAADEHMHEAEHKLLRDPSLAAAASGQLSGAGAPSTAVSQEAKRITGELQRLRAAGAALQAQAAQLMQGLGAARVGAVRALGRLSPPCTPLPLRLLEARQPVEHSLAPAAAQSHVLQHSPRRGSCALGFAPAVTDAEVQGALTPVMSFHKLARLKVKAATAARRLSRTYAQRMAGKVVAATRALRSFEAAKAVPGPPPQHAEQSTGVSGASLSQ